MAITWTTPAGSLGTVVERFILDIQLEANSDIGTVSYELIAGALPRGLRLENGRIVGSPTEVRKFTQSRFVIRASDTEDIEDRTFSIDVDGSDLPQWVTKEGFLNVGKGDAYYVLDNAYVDFYLEATDTDIISGDVLEYYLAPTGGELPPGLTLTSEGRIVGFTDPIFSVEYTNNPTGAYDTSAFDMMPLDVPQAESNGFDSYLYDTTIYDYNETVRTPRRLSRPYTFIVAVTDGVNEVRRLFRIWVVTEEFLQADNSIVQVDTNLFQADASSFRQPLWITESNLGRFRANNYITIRLDVYDPSELPGTIIYFKLATNPDGTDSTFPPGLSLDTITGDLAGKVPYQAAVTKSYQFSMLAVNFPLDLTASTLVGTWSSKVTYFAGQAVRYGEYAYIAKQEHRNQLPTNEDYWISGVSTAEKTFTIDIIGEIESSIVWLSDSNCGSIKPNQPSQLFVNAESLLYGGRPAYEFVSGKLPPGLNLMSTGDIVGKVKQFADDSGPGLTRFFERTDEWGSDNDSSTRSVDFTGTFDGGVTSFDKKFTFSIKARDAASFSESIKQFYITVIADNQKTFANLFLKAFQSKDKRLSWFNFITDANIFKSEDIYRYGDNNFGVQSELKILVFAGIESLLAVNYVQAMSRNHYRKQIQFGKVKKALAKNLETQETIYEAVYVDVIDDFENGQGQSISDTIKLSRNIESKVLISYDSIKIDSDVPLVSDSDHQRIFPNSIKNMRKRIKSLGQRDREFLPLWMRSTQENAPVEPGYVKSLILCYAKPGQADTIISRINASGFDFKSLDFTADRYLIDVLGGQIENKYLVFPQRGEKLP